MFPYPIQVALFCFQSLLLTESLLLSFPVGTKTLQFPTFSCLSAFNGNPIQIFPVQNLRAARRNLMQLVTFFRDSRANPSLYWRKDHILFNLDCSSSKTLPMHRFHQYENNKYLYLVILTISFAI